jgi:hypothetical protein
MKSAIQSPRDLLCTIYIPSLALAFEYQGEVHYKDISMYGELGIYNRRDSYKRGISKEHGITLIEIPFWWQKTEASLISTIRAVRPDIGLPASNSAPISLEMPTTLKANIHHILLIYNCTAYIELSSYMPTQHIQWPTGKDSTGWYCTLSSQLIYFKVDDRSF